MLASVSNIYLTTTATNIVHRRVVLYFNATNGVAIDNVILQRNEQLC